MKVAENLLKNNDEVSPEEEYALSRLRDSPLRVNQITIREEICEEIVFNATIRD